MSYPVLAMGNLAEGEKPAMPMTTKLAIAGVVAGGLLYASPEFKAWSSRLSGAQRLGIGLGVAGLFLGVMQIAMQMQRDRQMLTFERTTPGYVPPQEPTT